MSKPSRGASVARFFRRKQGAKPGVSNPFRLLQQPVHLYNKFELIIKHRMKLVEIEDLFTIDYGAPSPIIIANDNELYLTFYTTNEEEHLSVPHQRSESDDIGICTLRFKHYLKYTFGVPSNEAIEGHPYYKLGMKSASFYELEGSDLIDQLQNIDKVHPYYKPEKWKLYKHYILTFHDNMFECIAQEFIVELQNKTLNSQATIILDTLLKHDFNL